MKSSAKTKNHFINEYLLIHDNLLATNFAVLLKDVSRQSPQALIASVQGRPFLFFSLYALYSNLSPLAVRVLSGRHRNQSVVLGVSAGVCSVCF